MKELVIRSYSDSDEAAVIRLWTGVFPDNSPWNDPAEDIRRKLAVQRELFLVGELDYHVRATAMAGFDGHRGWVYYVAVEPAYRGRGFGRALMAEVEKRLMDLGAPKINLQIRASNPAVVAFYEKLGYTIEERVSMGKRLV